MRKLYYPGQCNGSPLPLSGTQPFTEVFVSGYGEETTEDIVTDNFQKMVAKGLIINNPYSNIQTLEYTPGLGIEGRITLQKRECYPKRWGDSQILTYTGYRKPSRIVWNGGLFLEPPDITAAIDQAVSVAVTDAWASIDSSEISALVSVLESEKTVKGLFDVSRRVYKFARNVKKLQLTKLKSQLGDLGSREAKRAWREIKDEFTLDALADRHLEVRYGLRPLYYDMMGALKAFFKEARLQRHTYRGRQDLVSHTSDTKVTTFVEDSSWRAFDFTLSRSCDVKVEIRAGVLCEVDYDSLDPWGLQSIAESMWDLVPYSFVIDWFFNVGDTLAAWTPNAGLSPRASWYKVKTTCTRVSNLSGMCLNPSYVARLDSGTYRVTESGIAGWFDGPVMKYSQHTVRTPHTDRYTLPTFTLRLNVAKLLDLAALSKNVLFGGSYPLIRRTRV
jgi:hypothetical protein